jgi:hypothetical protein
MISQFKLSPRARAAARQGADRYPLLGFNALTGKFNRDKCEVDLSGVRYIALMSSQSWGWLTFKDGRPVKIVGFVEDENFVPPEREDLGNLDKSRWPTGLDGTPSDPWSELGSIDLLNPTSGEVLRFEQTSWLGRSAITGFGRMYEQAGPFHPGQYPVVELGAEAVRTKTGRKFKPTFLIVGWVAAGPAAAPTLASDAPLQIGGPAASDGDLVDTSEMPPALPDEAYQPDEMAGWEPVPC